MYAMIMMMMIIVMLQRVGLGEVGREVRVGEGVGRVRERRRGRERGRKGRMNNMPKQGISLIYIRSIQITADQ